MSKAAYEEARLSWLCRGCLTPKACYTGIDVQLQQVPPLESDLNFVNGCGLGVARTDLLAKIGADVVKRDLYLGSVYGPGGDLIGDWSTFHGRHRLVIRGSRHVSFRKCEDCGRVVYFGMGKRYLFPMPPLTLRWRRLRTVR